MTTSGATTGLMTAGDIVRKAYVLNGAYTPEDSIPADRMDEGVNSLTWWLKTIQADGCNLWRDLDVSIAWPANTAEGALSANYADVFNVRYQDTNYARPVQRVERGDFTQRYGILTSQTTTSGPFAYSPYKQLNALWMKVWPVPSVEVTLLADVARIVEDVTDPGQNIDVPQEWTECLFYNLADRLSASCGTWVKDPTTAAKNQQRAEALYTHMRDWDRPGSVFLRPASYWG